ncbi:MULTISPECIES: PTS sugar transporter subunit IIA [unclassified Lactobacillus]|uniref:PTS sugar transporter subunit IIA n=1 Tax=unclassified Lactobacillus TaxID=2620435 RepID=UPI00226A1101|nr:MULTISPECIES: fructose PTS transporter subunit IIA [unclassified Lactobacillus]MCX8720621.1 PTS sugar transporter subunit IIA [Lactobacillus sp. B4010]MCX8731356.1 PTS sugar transporter subunit IIA [Lactobacillus sp. B4015]MCX8733577.1 PTS sugar transporter subunit IIA [Lactobacillus sp. B4012]
MKFTATDVFLDVDEQSVASFLEFAAKAAKDAGFTDDVSELKRSFLEREKEFSTGLEDGFAIPHAKTADVLKPGFLYFRLTQPIDWQTYDDQPVSDIFTLMVPPENAGDEHLKMLANLSTALLEDDFKVKLRELTSKKAIADFINQKIGE